MKKSLRVISIDGTRGSGKTSQINMLSKHLKALGFIVSTLKPGQSPQEIAIGFKYIDSFLPKDPKAMVIIDGSIARPMTTDLVFGKSSKEVVDSFKLPMHEFEKIDHLYGVVGLLFVMDDVVEANERVVNRSKMLIGQEVSADVGPVDVAKENEIVSGMRTFNNHIASKNINFHVFNIEPEDTILSVHKAVVDYLTERYDLPKLIKAQDDW